MNTKTACLLPENVKLLAFPGENYIVAIYIYIICCLFHNVIQSLV